MMENNDGSDGVSLRDNQMWQYQPRIDENGNESTMGGDGIWYQIILYQRYQNPISMRYVSKK